MRLLAGFARPDSGAIAATRGRRGVIDALVTCAAGNTASRKIIEKCGGEFMDEVDWQGTTVLRFWVETSQ